MAKQAYPLTNMVTMRTIKVMLLWAFMWVGCLVQWISGQVVITPITAADIGSLALEFEAPMVTNSSQLLSFGTIIRSELSYPTNCVRAGARVRYATPRAGTERRSLIFEVGGWTSLTDPYGKMKDSDYVGVKSTAGFTTIRGLVKFSYTESDLRASSRGALASIGLGPFRFWGRDMFLAAEYEYQYFRNEVFGYSGWFLDWADSTSTDSQKIPTGEQYPNTLVLTYAVAVRKPALQTRLILAERRLLWDCVLEFSPLAMAQDEDFHLLRNKKSTGATRGFSFGALTSGEARVTRHVGTVAAVGVDYLRTKGKMRQVFFGDDPGTEDYDETGLEYNGLTMWITQYSIHAMAGLQFRF